MEKIQVKKSVAYYADLPDLKGKKSSVSTGDLYVVRHDAAHGSQAALYKATKTKTWEFVALAGREDYPLDVGHLYDPNIAKILDTDPVRASTSVNPVFTQIINNVESMRRTFEAKLEALTGMVISGSVDGHVNLPDPAGLTPGTLFIVRNDETNDGQTTLWEVSAGHEWVFVSVLSFDLDLDGVLADFVTITQLNAVIAGIDLSNLDVPVSSRAEAAVMGLRTDPPAGAVNNVNTAIAYLKGILANQLSGELRGMRVREWWTPGSHSWQVPAGVTEIFVTGCGGGGGGSGFVRDPNPNAGGRGGGGGAATIGQRFAVTPMTILTITVGAGGSGGSINSAGSAGGATSISGVVTLAGGGGGSISSNGSAGGTGGGAGGANSSNLGGAGGGSLGGGGAGGGSSGAATAGIGINGAAGSNTSTVIGLGGGSAIGRPGNSTGAGGAGGIGGTGGGGGGGGSGAGVAGTSGGAGGNGMLTIRW